MTFTGPQSFLCLPGVAEPSSMGVSVGLQFRTWNEAGLLLTFKLSKQGGAVWLYLSKARLHLQVHKYGRVPLELNVGRSDIKPPTWNLFFSWPQISAHLHFIEVHSTFKDTQGILMFLAKPLTAVWHKSPHNPFSFMRYTVFVTPGSGLNDGQWHAVELLSRRGHLSVTLSGEDGAFAHASPPFLVTTGSHLFFGGKSNTCLIPHYSEWFVVWWTDWCCILSSGGCPAEDYSQECTNPFTSFQGCMRLLTVDSQPVDLIKMQQRLMGNYSHLQIDMCGITDRSDLNTPLA